MVRAQARDPPPAPAAGFPVRPGARPLDGQHLIEWQVTVCAPARRRRAARLRARALACAHAHVDRGTVTLTTLSRRALPYVTGCASLADIKMNLVELLEKDTCNATIVSALVARAVQRPRTAQHAHRPVAPCWPQGGARADGPNAQAARPRQARRGALETHAHRHLGGPQSSARVASKGSVCERVCLRSAHSDTALLLIDTRIIPRAPDVLACART